MGKIQLFVILELFHLSFISVNCFCPVRCRNLFCKHPDIPPHDSKDPALILLEERFLKLSSGQSVLRTNSKHGIWSIRRIWSMRSLWIAFSQLNLWINFKQNLFLPMKWGERLLLIFRLNFVSVALVSLAYSNLQTSALIQTIRTNGTTQLFCL